MSHRARGERGSIPFGGESAASRIHMIPVSAITKSALSVTNHLQVLSQAIACETENIMLKYIQEVK
jgi:hypothetical protein